MHHISNPPYIQVQRPKIYHKNIYIILDMCTSVKIPGILALTFLYSNLLLKLKTYLLSADLICTCDEPC